MEVAFSDTSEKMSEIATPISQFEASEATTMGMKDHNESARDWKLGIA